MKRLSIQFAVGIAVAAVTAAAVCKLATDEGLRAKVVGLFRAGEEASREHLAYVSEEVVARKAQIKRDPTINQEWVAQQWERAGY